LVLLVSTKSIWIGVDNTSILIGALPKDSFRRIMHHNGWNSTLMDLMPLASAMAWVENILNLTNGYNKVTGGEGDQFEYLVPIGPFHLGTLAP
jgi:hypothetical protein